MPTLGRPGIVIEVDHRLETGRSEEAMRFGTEQLQVSQRLTDHTVAAVEEPVLAALLLGKVAAAAERGVQIDVAVDRHPLLTGYPATHLTTVLGNLIDNAVDASIKRSGPGRVEVLRRADVRNPACPP